MADPSEEVDSVDIQGLAGDSNQALEEVHVDLAAKDLLDLGVQEVDHVAASNQVEGVQALVVVVLPFQVAEVDHQDHQEVGGEVAVVLEVLVVVDH